MKMVVYHIATGKILRLVDAPPGMLAIQAQNETEAFLIGEANDRLQYVYQGEILDRPIMSIDLDKSTLLADGEDVVTISGVPGGAMLTAINQSAKETLSGLISQSDTFATAITGKIALRIEKWPYLPWEATIDAI